MIKANRHDLEMQGQLRREAAGIASAMLAGETGLIDGVRRLASLAHDLVDDWTADADFRVFGALAGEADHLPAGEQRALWAADALAARDAEVHRMERDARTEVEAACRGVIARFGAGDPRTNSELTS